MSAGSRLTAIARRSCARTWSLAASSCEASWYAKSTVFLIQDDIVTGDIDVLHPALYGMKNSWRLSLLT